MYDDTRYEYRSMEIPCPLCECMLSRLRMAQHQLSKTLKAIQDIEKKPIAYCRADGTYENGFLQAILVIINKNVFVRKNNH